ncbi:MAG: hypothetical protein GC137_06850 [Alphaproteobacteria bacterium]|nr:hypothetical protein [Alphaproteobacteria bacterium]
MKVDTTLLREKFVIREKNADADEKALEFVCPSSRVALTIEPRGRGADDFVIRGKNMHACVRVAALIVNEYDKRGPILVREPPFKWDELWKKIVNDYERRYNQERWIAVYFKGRPIFQDGNYHPFVDVIEKCDMINTGPYEKSIDMAETAFKQTGKDVDIKYDSNVALVSVVEDNHGRCSLIIRGPANTKTFNFTMHPLDQRDVLPPVQLLISAANFLEGIQLCYMTGFSMEKINKGIIKSDMIEHKQAFEARKRINELNSTIKVTEGKYRMNFRPERPNFYEILKDTEEIARKLIPDPEPKVGEDMVDNDDGDMIDDDYIT